jgi:hypothetical protein
LCVLESRLALQLAFWCGLLMALASVSC